MLRLRVTQLATSRSIVGTPDELLEWLPQWWPDEDPDDREIHAMVTQAVYEWERGILDGWRNERLGVRVESSST